MDNTKREIYVGKNKVYFGKDNIIHYTIVGEVSEKMAIEIKDVVIKFHNMVEGKINSLIDLNKAGKQPTAARRIGVKMFKHEKAGKIALFGLHPVAKVLASFVIGVTRKANIRFFKTREEALSWLKE